VANTSLTLWEDKLLLSWFQGKDGGFIGVDMTGSYVADDWGFGLGTIT